MGSVSLDLDFEEFKKAAKNLSEEQQEELLFELHPPLRKALQRMEKEALQEKEDEQTVSIDELE